MIELLLDQDFKEMLFALSAAGAEYLIVGGQAMAAHGHARFTRDFDIWVKPDPENARRVWRALAEYGAPALNYDVNDFAKPDMIVQFGLPPHRIDMITSVEGLTFEEAWPNRSYAKVDHLEAPVLGRADLIRNKRAVGRLQDLADVETLEGIAKHERRRKK